MKIAEVIVDRLLTENIRDPEFKRWFGNSRVVDFQGKPLIVYHGGSYPSAGPEFKGDTWFTIHVRDAYQYAKSGGNGVTSAYLSVQNPYVLSPGEDIYSVLGRVRNSSEYDGVHDPEVGDWIVWTSHQIRPIKTRKISESSTAGSNNTITLRQLYGDNFPDSSELQFWDCVRPHELDTPLTIHQLSPTALRITLLSQYRVEDPEELLDLIGDDSDRRELVQRYRSDSTQHIIVLCNNRIVDGNHRALAAVLERRPLRYVNLDELENSELDEAVLDPRGAGSTPYGVDIDYFGLRVQMRPSTFLKLALPLTPATTSKTLGPYMKQGGAIAHPMLEFEMPDDWFSGDYSEPARIVDHEGRNRMKHWMRLHGDDPIQINMIQRGLRRKHITSQMIEQLSAGIIGQRGDYIRGPLFEPSTALEEGNILSEIQYSNSIADSSRITAALNPSNSTKLGVVDHCTVYKLDANDCYVYYLYDNESNKPLAYIITEKFKTNGYYPFRQAEKLVNTSGVAMALLQFLRHTGIKLVVRSDEPLTLKGITWLTKIIQNPRGLKIHDGSGKSVNLQELWNEWNASHEDYENAGTVSIFIESKNDPSKLDYCFEDQTNYDGLMRNPLRYIGDKRLY